MLLERARKHSCDAADGFVGITVLTNSGKESHQPITSDSINICMLLYDVRVFDGLDARSVTATEPPKFKFKQRAMFRKEMKRALSFRFHWTNKYRTILPERFFGQGHPVPKAPCSDAVQLFRPLVSYPIGRYQLSEALRKAAVLVLVACNSEEIWLVALGLWHPP